MISMHLKNRMEKMRKKQKKFRKIVDKKYDRC